MDKSKLRLFSLLLIALAGLFITEHGITGLISYDSTIKQLCETDSECNLGSCCKFQEQDAGVCDFKENCAVIAEIAAGHPGAMQLTNPGKKDLWMETVSGIIVSILTFSLFIYFMFFTGRERV